LQLNSYYVMRLHSGWYRIIVGCELSPIQRTFLEEDFMPAQHITEYERKWVEALNRGDVSMADEVFTPDCVIHITGSPEPIRGTAGFKQMLEGMLAAFPDLHFTIEDQFVADDKVATRWKARGTNTGPLGEIQPTGRRVEVEGLILDRVMDGKVAERWEQWDQPGMMQQLGLM
jgi:steroid delta-isomerase-like uncharacterized protein